METLLPILENVSNVIGVPAVICLVWAAFVIRDHARRIHILEVTLSNVNDKQAAELNRIYDRINAMAQDVAFIKGKMSKNNRSSSYDYKS